MRSWKKATALVLGLLLLAAGDRLGVSATTPTLMAGLIASYIGAQGLADHGKSKALIEKAEGVAPR